MIVRKILYDQMHVSKLGIGTSAFGSRVSKKDSLYILNDLFEKGINYIDTSPYYGLGNSEKIIGEAIKENREHFYISTKFGILAPKISFKQKLLIPFVRKIYFIPGISNVIKKRNLVTNYTKSLSFEEVIASIVGSFESLNTDYIDRLMIHNNIETYINNNKIMDYLCELKYRGIIRSLGFTFSKADNINNLSLNNFENYFDAVQIPYSEREFFEFKNMIVNFYSIFSNGIPNIIELNNLIVQHNGHFIFLLTNKKIINDRMSIYA